VCSIGGGILAPSTGRGIEKFPSPRNSPCFGRGRTNRKEPNFFLFADHAGVGVAEQVVRVSHPDDSKLLPRCFCPSENKDQRTHCPQNPVPDDRKSKLYPKGVKLRPRGSSRVNQFLIPNCPFQYVRGESSSNIPAKERTMLSPRFSMRSAASGHQVPYRGGKVSRRSGTTARGTGSNRKPIHCRQRLRSLAYFILGCRDAVWLVGPLPAYQAAERAERHLLA
jgi:ribosomal protein S14